MSEYLLTSKLYIPPLRTNLVSRPRLIQLMNEGLQFNHQVTLVSAPPGFGKTTLVVEWLKQANLPAAWLSLDESDNEMSHFLAYLAAALQHVDEGISASLLGALRSPQLPALEEVLTDFLNEIAVRKELLILVLDDFHLLTEPAISKAVAFWVQHLPPQLHLVITTREDPDLPLARLRARDQLTEIRARDLRFTQGEADTFLRVMMGLELSWQDVAVLEDRTEGWAAGLHLAGLSMQRHPDLKSFIAEFSGTHRHILDYLTDEVLQQQPEEIRDFLLQTAILDRFSSPLCNALTERADSARLLAQLETSNLFVIPLDEERRWYRYHHLISDLLRSQLTRSHPEWIPELHRRASHWFEDQGDIHAAVEHALQASDLSRAAQLIEMHTMPKLFKGEVARVVSWFDRLPEAILKPAPMLCIYKAWALVLVQRGARWGEVEQAMQAADQALERVNAGEALRDLVAGHKACIQAFLMRIPALKSKNPEKLIALSQEALRLLPAEERAIRSTAALNMAYGYMALADLQASRAALEKTLEEGVSGGNFYAAIYGPTNLAIIALLMGHLKEALQICDTYIEKFNRALAGQYFPPIGALYILKGGLLLEYDCLAEAEQALTEGIELVRWTGESIAPKKGYTALARLRLIQGERSAMLETVQTLEETWPEGALYARSLRHRLSISDRPDDPQVHRDAAAWLAISGIEFGGLAGIDGLDPLSMTAFECNLNAAHVLAHLAKGKAGVYAPGIYPVEDADAYLRRQQDLAVSRGFTSQVVEILIARTLLYQAVGKKADALEVLEAAIGAAAPTGLFRIFVDEGAPLRAMLEELKPRLSNASLVSYVNRLLDGMSGEVAKPAAREGYHRDMLGERELEVLHCLARGLTYEEIGQEIYLSLNTVQFHVKNIYSKLRVNRRMQALEKARELKLI